MSFGDWLISLHIISSRFTCFVARDKISFLVRLNYIPLNVYTTLCLYISQWTFALLPFLTAANNATMNLSGQIFLSNLTFNSFGYILRIGIVGSYGNSIFSSNLFKI